MQLMKKRNLLFGLLALELVTLPFAIPAAAQIIDRVSFKIPQRVASVKLDAEPGTTRIVITSNAPFTIATKNAIGDFNVTLLQSGKLNAARFGDNAQMPGPAMSCGTAISSDPVVIYRATQKTARRKGPILSQSVIAEISYDADLRPDFIVKTEDNSTKFSAANACELGDS